MPEWQAPHRWDAPAQRWRCRPPPAMRSWLEEPGSLTKRLQAAAEGDFAVRMVWQGWGRPLRDEARRLGLPADRLALLREVELMGKGQVWVRARSVIPLACLRSRSGRRLRYLGNRSLGGLLFKDPGLRRDGIETGRVQQGDVVLWVRRSRLVFHGYPLLVAESFLPEIVAPRHLHVTDRR